ncbi:hypothetical protein [Chitinophaga nivalis]|uniref:Uncharacterized protein n=1 Tax=Chitinophaga nivalis TaxID=2991709 RepID=A0ABT3IHU4_9BACT|nr:hypothetical protein [Chitinophaga nivalis]MCW3466782.1 hypothetical protein [Chitinophaga nivalis]MCW3483527.1 hypothetical protein [Chitinophaga nivalis]
MAKALAYHIPHGRQVKEAGTPAYLLMTRETATLCSGKWGINDIILPDMLTTTLLKRMIHFNRMKAIGFFG